MRKRGACRLVLLLCILMLCSVAYGKTSLSLMMYGTPDQEFFFNLVKEGFEKDNPDYEMVFEIVPYGEYIAKVQVRYAAGAAPDVFLTWAQYKSMFVEDGMLLDLTDRINKSSIVRLDKFFPVIKDNISYQGRYWGTPWGFNSTLWIVNMDLLDEAGVAFPGYDWTVDDLRTASRKVARPEEQIFGTAHPLSGAHAIQWLENWAGHKWIDESQREVLVDSPGSVAMLEYWQELVQVLHVAPSSQYPRRSGATFMGTGDLAFWQTWSTETQNIVKLIQQGVEPFRWRFTTYPKAPHDQGHFAQGHLWSIPSNHPRPDQAWKLAEWLGGEACDYIWSASQRTPPTMPIRKHWDVYNQLLPEAQRQEVQNFIINILYGQGYARDFEYWPTFGQMSSVMGSAISRVLSGGVSAQEAMKQASTQMQAILNEYWAKRNQ
ncbi:MAG: ABC transporter substrate-binding protein [Limnochordia bacterium]|jgi:ABC-type glycerol-3-phosphate transport system substrate-binding protein